MKPSHGDVVRELGWNLTELLPLCLVRARRRIGHAAVLRQFARDRPGARIQAIRTRAAEDDRIVVLVIYQPGENIWRFPRPVACYVVPTDSAHEIPYDPSNPYYSSCPR